MNYLITGANGFVGNAFSNYVMDYDTLNTSLMRYDLPTYDILKINDLIPKDKYDMCVHFAAIADLNDSFRDQDKNFEVNIRGTYEVAKFCVKHDIPLVFISTCCVYHSDDDVIDEITYPLTDEPYACSKMAGEYILKGVPGLRYTILRIGTVYGPGMREELFNYIAIDKAIKHEQIKVNGDGGQVRTYIFIDDLIDGIFRACNDFDKVEKEIINLCGSEQISIMDTIHEIASWQEFGSLSFKRGFKRFGDFQHENISIEKAEKILGWKPVVKYSDGMKRVYEWHKTLQK